MRLVFSRDRPAQLDLLLRSLDRHAPEETTWVLWTASTPEFEAGYAAADLVGYRRGSYRESDFNEDLRRLLVNCPDQTVTFFCDDDVLYRDLLDARAAAMLVADDQLLCVSLRLGRGNQQMRLPDGFPLWRWARLPRHDFGFPASVDGHTFRVKDVLALIGQDAIENPTALETVMAARVEGVLATQRPLMGCFDQQVLVGVPVNRVSATSGVANGDTYPQPVEALNDRWLAGERIALDQLDFTGVVGCHHEVPFVWELRP